MALQNFQYDTIMREYSRRQSRSRRELEERRQEAFLKVPRLAQIDEEVASLSAARARSLLGGSGGSLDELKKEIADLSRERISLLEQNGYPADYLEPHYICPQCQDTGYIGSRKCSCFKKAEIELLYTQSNLSEILEKRILNTFLLTGILIQLRTKQRGSLRWRRPDTRITPRRILSGILIPGSRTCFSTAAPVWARRFCPTALPGSF